MFALFIPFFLVPMIISYCLFKEIFFMEDRDGDSMFFILTLIPQALWLFFWNCFPNSIFTYQLIECTFKDKTWYEAQRWVLRWIPAGRANKADEMMITIREWKSLEKAKEWLNQQAIPKPKLVERPVVFTAPISNQRYRVRPLNPTKPFVEVPCRSTKRV